MTSQEQHMSLTDAQRLPYALQKLGKLNANLPLSVFVHPSPCLSALLPAAACPSFIPFGLLRTSPCSSCRCSYGCISRISPRPSFCSFLLLFRLFCPCFLLDFCPLFLCSLLGCYMLLLPLVSVSLVLDFRSLFLLLSHSLSAPLAFLLSLLYHMHNKRCPPRAARDACITTSSLVQSRHFARSRLSSGARFSGPVGGAGGAVGGPHGAAPRRAALPG